MPWVHCISGTQGNVMQGTATALVAPYAMWGGVLPLHQWHPRQYDAGYCHCISDTRGNVIHGTATASVALEAMWGRVLPLHQWHPRQCDAGYCHCISGTRGNVMQGTATASVALQEMDTGTATVAVGGIKAIICCNLRLYYRCHGTALARLWCSARPIMTSYVTHLATIKLNISCWGPCEMVSVVEMSLQLH